MTALCMLVIIQEVYSQTPDPSWTAEEMTCGIWSGPALKIKYSIDAHDSGAKFWCGYCFFRDGLSIFCWAALVYMWFIFAFGGMPTYWRYIQQSVDAIIYGITLCNCTFSCSPQGPKAGNSCDCWGTMQLIFFALFAAVLIALFPEIAFLYHVVVDLYILGGSKYSNSESCCCCARDAQEVCCDPIRLAPEPAKKDVQVVVVNPDGSAATKNTLVDPTTSSSSIFNDSLRPRIQFVTKYKPVPIGPPNP